jgi:transcriptional regulator with XRE-family HTH domain
MELTTTINLNLAKRFRTASFFHKFFLARTKDEIATRIRDLREQRDFTQKQFADKSGMKQSAVSRLEQSDYAGWNFKTLARIAETLDARLSIDFIPREDVIRHYEATAKSISALEGKSIDEAMEAAFGEASRNTFQPSDLATQTRPTARDRIRPGNSEGISGALQFSGSSSNRARDRGAVSNF